jgi:hypothetical protein
MQRTLCSCQVLVKLNFLDRFSKNTQISNFMKSRPVGTELLHAGRQMDRYNEPNSRFLRYCERPRKFYVLPTQYIYVFCVDLRTNSNYFRIQH